MPRRIGGALADILDAFTESRSVSDLRAPVSPLSVFFLGSVEMDGELDQKRGSAFGFFGRCPCSLLKMVHSAPHLYGSFS
jgi:hypothetical protein